MRVLIFSCLLLALANAQTVDTDCDGSWSECTSSCESAAQRSWTETQAKSGNGANCPVATDCQPGDGACPDLVARNDYSELTDSVSSVTFDETFDNPIVMLGILSINSGDHAHPRIASVSSTSVRFFVDESPHCDGTHAEEAVSYLTLESGVTLNDANRIALIQTGTANVQTNYFGDFTKVYFDEPFDEDDTIVVIVTVQSNNGPDYIKPRVRGVTHVSFEVTMEETDFANGSHTVETIAYIAGPVGRWNVAGTIYEFGTLMMEDTSFYQIKYSEGIDNSLVFGQIMTYFGPQPVNLRYQNKDDFGFEMRMHEDSCAHNDNNHALEKVGYLIVGDFTVKPSTSPTTNEPTATPSISPTTDDPSISPTSDEPSISPTTNEPTATPSISPTTDDPSISPTSDEPTTIPTIRPTTDAPTTIPTIDPTTDEPTTTPTISPTSDEPSIIPTTNEPTAAPSISPTTDDPSISPTSDDPTTAPTISPTTDAPTTTPTIGPTTDEPTTTPTISPTTDEPTKTPTTSPTTDEPSTSPTTDQPSNMPFAKPFSILIADISNYHGNPFNIKSEIPKYGSDYVEFRQRYHEESRRDLSGSESASNSGKDKVARMFIDNITFVWTFISIGSILGCFLIVTLLYAFKSSCLSKNAYTLMHIGDEAA